MFLVKGVRRLGVDPGKVGLGCRKTGVLEGVARGFDLLGLAGFQHILPVPFVAFFPAGFFALCCDVQGKIRPVTRFLPIPCDQ